ncbi:zinc finger protein RFP-like [Alligator mississippiensis]|uniref:Zinc finger protein RFP-like n=1 Tax=Alligator mississippiensis TaxID=8496 RepID=A0A151MAI7_ALLMI|nr:zinc finger protein RFP-like [Alligator mississippiensis]
MATRNPVENLQDDTTCFICLEFFKDPVMIMGCGHSFCQACISQCWEGKEKDVSCPQCRLTFPQRNLCPNRLLANFVSIAKQLKAPAANEAEEQWMCKKHGEALKLFCDEDQILLCVVCERSQAHQAHTVVPIKEAAREHKEKIQAHLKTLREEREKLLAFRMTGEERSKEYLKWTKAERQKILSGFQHLHQFLKEQEQLLLAQLEELEREIETIQKENITKMSKEISILNNLIKEMEGKCLQPADAFLQDVRSTSSRCDRQMFQLPVEISPELEPKVRDVSCKTVAIMEILRTIKGTLTAEMGKGWAILSSYTKVKVTLDPATAHPHLILAEDRSSMTRGDKLQKLPDNAERFDTHHCVLGYDGFSAGRHYWEVEVEDGGFYAVGVARASVRRKGWSRLDPEAGIWAIWHLSDTLQSYLEKDSYSKVKVTLDPDSANPQLILSEDRSCVRWEDTRQLLSKNSERFDMRCCVLGHEGFTSGRHCWEVEVRKGNSWAVGVARESVKRKGWIHVSPEEGVWALGHWYGQFQVLTSPHPTPLQWLPSRVQVCLDYAEGQVSILNANTKAPIFTFPPALFAGDRIHPWFYLFGPGAEFRLWN